MMKALVTGSEGFVGPYLTELLVEQGFEVYGTYLEKPDNLVDIKRFKTDVTDKKKLKKTVLAADPDYVFHLAGFSSVKESRDKPSLCHEVNVEGTRNLLDCISEAGLDSTRTLIVSSSQVYGRPVSLPIDENHPFNPLNPYAQSRKEQEELALKYDLDLVVARSFNHTGPRQPPGFVVPDFARQIALIEKGAKKPQLKVGNLKAKRDFTDVRDIVKAYLLALQECPPKEVYNICSGKAYQISNLLETLMGFSKKDVDVHKDESLYREADVQKIEGDYSKFKDETGWTPMIPITQTLKETLQYWRKKTN